MRGVATTRPITATLLIVAAGLVLLNLWTLWNQRMDWRSKCDLEEGRQPRFPFPPLSVSLNSSWEHRNGRVSAQFEASNRVRSERKQHYDAEDVPRKSGSPFRWVKRQQRLNHNEHDEHDELPQTKQAVRGVRCGRRG